MSASLSGRAVLGNDHWLICAAIVFRANIKYAPSPITQARGISFYNSIDSTSATNLPASSPRYEATTLNTASLKPPMFRMSARSGVHTGQR